MVYFMFFGVKRVLWHALHISFPSSEDLMSTWHWEKAKFEAVFVLDLLLYYWLFINLPMSTESEFALLKTAKVIFVWYTPEIFLKIIKIHHFPCWRLQWSKLRSVMTDQISNLTEQSFPKFAEMTDYWMRLSGPWSMTNCMCLTW